MTDMVERVARAVHESLSRANIIAYLDMPEDTANVVARAAIEAMREPSNLMTYRGQMHRNESAWSIGAIWREMIDAALSQSGEGFPPAA